MRLISARQVVQDALEAHYGTWRADGDPEWAEVAAVVIDGLHATGRIRVMGSDAAHAVGRFRPDGPVGYRAATMPDAPLRATFDEAVADEATWLECKGDACL